MRIVSKYRVLLFLFVVTFLSCKNDEIQPTTNINKYSEKHALSVDTILISGSASIKVKSTFNLAFDPTINEIGVMLTNDLNRIIGKKVFGLSTIKSKETTYFDSLSIGSYSVRSYLINHNKKDTIYSNTETIKIQNIDFNDYAITCYPSYYSSDDKAVYSKSTGEFIVIFLHTNRELPLDEIKIKLGDNLIFKPNNIEKEISSEIKKYEYYIQLNITDNIPSGVYDVELTENNVKYPTGVQIDKLSGSWERINSLFSGKLKGGTKIYFQSGKDAFIGIGESFYVSNSKINLFKFDLQNYTWEELTTLDLSPKQIWDQNTGVVINNTGYALLNIFTDYELWAYDIIQNKWIFITSAPNEMKKSDGAIVYFLNNKLYLAGGTYASTGNELIYLNTVWCYNIERNEWTKKNNKMPFNYRGFSYTYSTFSSSKSAYFIFSNASLREFWRYTEADDSWTKLSIPYPLLSEGGRAIYHNGLFYYVGGKLITSFFDASTNCCYTYSEQTNTWKQIANLPNEISCGTAFEYNNHLFFGMGYGSYAASLSMFKYSE
ncbi:Kelch repeat type 1-containing protein [Paludibacter propionicigenes WB4]|uniref:Kelch repeat type 1-containing protein n=1 Tax=Paludibacter propionicigenes (strain DSM 17365 / JCM 13257 / WB4) TaxID=694427 RepID=E4T712_PALPW|nr:kelch repeat-containing protein [Paludibacter propionicigenes]ADQ80506.1 Kelch repeat type 1-containing protein [Paludibacter propionicigenes WB4]